MTGVEEIQQLQEGGFSAQQIEDHVNKQKAVLMDGGYSSSQANAHYGTPDFDPAPIKEFMQENLRKQPKSATTFEEALDAGFQGSSSGLALRGKSPDVVLTEDTPRLARIAGSVAGMVGDVPAMLAGAAIGGGGGPITAFGGAVALPGGIRKILMDKYENGEVATFSDFWDRASGAVVETVKGWVVGAATGGVGKAVKMAPLMVSNSAKAAATLTGEAAVMTAVGSALEGKVPNANDFTDAAVVLGFAKGSVHVAGKLRGIYARTGTTPTDVVKDAEQDPSILQDLASHNRDIPKVYQDAALDQMAKERRDKTPIVERRPTGDFVDVPAPKPSITDLARKQQDAVDETSKAGAFRDEPYAQQRLHQEGSVVTRPITDAEEVKQYASTAFYEVFPKLRGKHEVTDTAETPIWYRAILDKTGSAPWEVDRALERLREHGEPQKALDHAVLDEIVNDQSLIREVQKLPKDVPDTQLERSQYEKPRMFRTAEEILQERNVLKNAEDMISREPRPSIREKMYILPRGRGPVIDHADMAELTKELGEHGMVWGKDGKPAWEENIPLEDAHKQILDRIVQHEPGTERMSLRALYTSIFDNLNSIRMKLRDEGLEGLPTSKNPYDLQRLTRGVMGKAHRFLHFGAVDFSSYKSVTRGYLKIMEPVKKELDQFRTYMVSKRVIEKEGQGIKTGFSLEAAKQVVEAGKGKYEKVFQERLGYRNAMLGYLRDSGILSQERVDAMRKANTDYVPFYRFFEEEQTSGKATSTAGVRDPIKEMKGGEQKIVDPIVSDIKDTFLFIGLAERNAARQSFVRLGPKFATLVRAKSDPVTAAEIKSIVEEHGVTEEAAKAISALRPSSFRVAKNEITVFENGERNVYKVHPEEAEAFEDVDRTSAAFLTRIFVHGPASWLRAGVVVTPDFIGRNILRDAVSSFIFAGSNPLKTVRGAISLAREDSSFQKWLAGGGANATMVAIDRDYIQSHIFALNAQTGIAERALNVVKTPVELLRIMSEFVENSTRLGSVVDQLAKTEDKATIQALALISRDATVDFGRHGKDTQGLSKGIAFFNPALQGIDRFAHALKDQPVATVSRALLSVTLPSMLLWYANKDDKEIQNLPRWQKDLFWLARMPLPGGGSFILRMPKSHEIGILFGSLAERMMDAFFKDNPDAFKDLDRSIMGVLLPSMVYTTAVPVVEQFANRSSFTGGPLIPADREGLMPEYQYNEYTTESAKIIGKIFGAFPGMEHLAMHNHDLPGGIARALTTPALVENYVRQWTGGIGMYVMQLADAALYATGTVPDPVKPTPTLADIPVIKAFVARYPSSSAQSIQDFFETYNVNKRYYDTMMHLAKEGDPKASALMAKHKDALVQLDDIHDTLMQLSKVIQDVNKNPKNTPSDKRQLIDSMQMNRIDISKAGNAILKEVAK